MAPRGLMEQDLSKLDVTKLHPLSPEVISRQATINIGTDTNLLRNVTTFSVCRFYMVPHYTPCALFLIS
jgi:hypothetical protein